MQTADLQLSPAEMWQVTDLVSLPFVLDPRLSNCITRNMIENGWQDFDQVVTLVCRNEGILDLSDIGQLRGLEQLDLSNDEATGFPNRITDYSPLANLDLLELLVVDWMTEPVDLTAILAIENLQYLSIVDGDLVEIPEEGQYRKMRELFLRHTKGVDAISFSMFPELRVLDVGENDMGQLLVDHNPLLEVLFADQNQLVRLNLEYNPLLTAVDVSNNLVADIDSSLQTPLAADLNNSAGIVQSLAYAADFFVSGPSGYSQLASDSATTNVVVRLTLAADAPVLVDFGTTIGTMGALIGKAQGGSPFDTPSFLSTSGPLTPFDFSINSSSSITA